MFGPMDDLFDFDQSGNLDDIEKAAEIGFISESFDEDEYDDEDFDEDEDDEY